MRRSLALTLALCGTLAAAACDGGAVSGLAVGGNGNVVVSVGAGSTPTISWTGGNATQLAITQSTGGGVFWDVHTLTTQGGFAPPVTFGVVPPGGAQSAPSTALATGTDYRVTVTTLDGSTGTRVFRP